MSNLSEQEQLRGRTLVEQLSRVNPRLSPNELRNLIPAYKEFIPMRKAIGLWSTLEAFPRIMRGHGQYDKVALLLSGVASGGKDAIRQEIEDLFPGVLLKPVSATSRKPREGEVEGKDYYFKDPASFQTAVENDEFIEWVQQGERFYGLPKQSMQDALTNPSPIVCAQVEMSAWPLVEEYIAGQSDVKTFVLKLFVLPFISFSEYRNMLEQTRDDVGSRLVRSGWEIAEAPNRADFIVTNRFRDTGDSLRYTAQAVVNHSLMLIPPQRGYDYALSSIPFEISRGIYEANDVVRHHDNVV